MQNKHKFCLFASFFVGVHGNGFMLPHIHQLPDPTQGLYGERELGIVDVKLRGSQIPIWMGVPDNTGDEFIERVLLHIIEKCLEMSLHLW